MVDILIIHGAMAVGCGIVVLYCYWLSGGFK
jgi:hypothetical protein